MPLANWIHKYPHVQALQQPDEVLTYAPDGDPIGSFDAPDVMRMLAWAATQGGLYGVGRLGHRPQERSSTRCRDVHRFCAGEAMPPSVSDRISTAPGSG